MLTRVRPLLPGYRATTASARSIPPKRVITTWTVLAGRIFAEVDGPVNTGLAIFSPNDVLATIDFYFTDTTGTRFPSGSATDLPQIAKFRSGGRGGHWEPSRLNHRFPSRYQLSGGSPMTADEFLITTLPIAPLSSASQETTTLPRVGWRSGHSREPNGFNDHMNVGFLGPGTGRALLVHAHDDDGNHGIRRSTQSLLRGHHQRLRAPREFGFGGDEGLAITARLTFPRSVAVDSAGGLYIADSSNHRIRKLTPMTGPVAPCQYRIVLNPGSGSMDRHDLRNDRDCAGRLWAHPC